MATNDSKAVIAAGIGLAATALVYNYLKHQEEASGREPRHHHLKPQDARSHKHGHSASWTKPVVIASPALEDLAKSLSKRLGSDVYTPEEGATIYLDKFKSGDINAKFNWQRVVGRKVVLLIDTVDQSRFFEQLALLQALQGFPVPDSQDKGTKWKTYVDSGTYSWGRAASITVVLPWYRPCQMERTSRWQLNTESGKWTNADPNGQWLDVPCALYYARLLATPGSVPPLPGPSGALDGMPLTPLWRPPLELLFVELHEEKPVTHAVSDLNTTVRTERYVPYFLDKYKGKRTYPGRANMYVLFPDRGAFDRYNQAVTEVLKLDPDHILYMAKTRVGDSIEQVQKLFYDMSPGQQGEKTSFSPKDGVLIIDDFTNSGGTLLGAVELIKSKTQGEGTPTVDIFVSHLVATYDEKVVEGLRKKLHGLGDKCRLFVTNSIPRTTAILKDDPQVEVCDLSDFIADALLEELKD
jgi:phosphoribosylpyrophosphate synthetase